MRSSNWAVHLIFLTFTESPKLFWVESLLQVVTTFLISSTQSFIFCILSRWDSSTLLFTDFRLLLLIVRLLHVYLYYLIWWYFAITVDRATSRQLQATALPFPDCTTRPQQVPQHQRAATSRWCAHETGGGGRGHELDLPASRRGLQRLFAKFNF